MLEIFTRPEKQIESYPEQPRALAIPMEKPKVNWLEASVVLLLVVTAAYGYLFENPHVLGL